MFVAWDMLHVDDTLVVEDMSRVVGTQAAVDMLRVVVDRQPVVGMLVVDKAVVDSLVVGMSGKLLVLYR